MSSARFARSNTTRLVAALILTVVPITSCSDGTPAFCTDLASARKLDGIVTALRNDKLTKATNEAQRLKDLAEKAPSEIRSDLTELADGVIDIIDLVKRDQQANSVSDGASEGSGEKAASATADTTPNDGDDDTQDDLTATSPPNTEPTDVEQRRNELNTRLGELDERSQKVSSWALEECGITL